MSTARVAIAGSSGSIGEQTLDVIRAEAGRYEVVGLGVGSSIEVLIAQANEFRPKVVAVADDRRRAEVAAALPFAKVVADLADLADDADVVVNGVVGFAGLVVTVRTLQMGKRLALANKESLIAGAPVVQPLRATAGAELVPVDSEHCAVHQCLRSSADTDREVSRIVLTASGGPFRGRQASDLADVGVEQALAHPTWKMGPKITIDSSTLMNKGLEVIEAHELFGTDYDRIEVVVHPQSVMHSMVEFSDGSTIAQLSMPDMRLPIGYALAYPNRISTAFGRIDWATLQRLDFEGPRHIDVPMPAVGIRSRPNRFDRAGLAQRRERGCGRRVPQRPDSVVADRRGV
jgi:1-deoxy-D-xylulose-5-phosphate reductoisomerase